ncbi:MAG: peroxiredoxin [Alphaproteobacteria bacterium]|nr:peroxiredoxin [Alphaproteobacteria bacterium]
MILQAIDKTGQVIEFDDNLLKNKITVLYFYPKDNTSGCTKEACDFRDNMNRLTTLANVIGVSPDSIESHKKFQQKQSLNFMLVADTEHKLAQKYAVWKEKSMYGRKYMGIERSTFILDTHANITHEWRKVKVAGHVAEVLNALTNMQK